MTYTECDLILIAGVGGFALSMMNLYEDSQKPKSKRIPKDFYFWLFFVFWPIAGAGYALLNLLEGNTLKPMLAFSVGATTPIALKETTKIGYLACKQYAKRKSKVKKQ